MKEKETTYLKNSTVLPTVFKEKDLSFYLRQIREDISELAEEKTLRRTPEASHKNIIILISSEYLGEHNPVGKKLLELFLESLANHRIKPKAVILINNGVKLACGASRVFTKLITLSEQEISILICDESVKELKIDKDIKIGHLVDMNAICDNLLNAWKVITI